MNRIIMGMVLVSMLSAAGCQKITSNGQDFPARFDDDAEMENKNSNKATIESVISIDEFVDRKRLQTRRATTEALNEKSCYPWKGALINHHVLAADLMWQTVIEMYRCNPHVKRIILLSPDHFQQSQAAVTTFSGVFRSEKIEWQTDDDALMELIGKNPFIKSSQAVIKKDHGIGAPLRFLFEVYPENTKVLPFIINANINRDEAMQFLYWLKKQMNDETMIVVSSDLSHYRPKAEAQSKTDEFENRLKINDSEFFWNANDSYTDNGKSLWLISQLVNAQSWSSINSAASWNYGGSTLNTTTYIVGFWKK